MGRLPKPSGISLFPGRPTIGIGLQGKRGRVEQFFQPDGQLADPDTGRVVDGIGDRRVGADITELAQTLDAEIVDQVILLGD